MSCSVVSLGDSGGCRHGLPPRVVERRGVELDHPLPMLLGADNVLRYRQHLLIIALHKRRVQLGGLGVIKKPFRRPADRLAVRGQEAEESPRRFAHPPALLEDEREERSTGDLLDAVAVVLAALLLLLDGRAVPVVARGVLEPLQVLVQGRDDGDVAVGAPGVAQVGVLEVGLRFLFLG